MVGRYNPANTTEPATLSHTYANNLENIHMLAEQLADSPNNDMRRFAAIIYSSLGSLYGKSLDELAEHVTMFSKVELERINKVSSSNKERRDI